MTAAANSTPASDSSGAADSAGSADLSERPNSSGLLPPSASEASPGWWRPARSKLVSYWPALLGGAFWVAAPLFCIYAIYIGIHQLTNNFNNAVPGIPGNFAVSSHNCQQQLCITSGTFTSEDKQLVEPDLIGDYRWAVGSTNRAVYNATSGEVTGIPDVWDPTPTVVGGIGSFVFLGLWAYLLVGARRQRHRQPAEVTGSSTSG